MLPQLDVLSSCFPVMLAPMAGVTDRPFRRLARRFGCPVTWTEMVASAELLRGRGRGVFDAPEEDGILAVQLAGRDPEVLADAARLAQDRGAALIDLNMGCPVRKVVGGLGGAALMRDESLAQRLMERVVSAVSVPVSVKMRLGWDDTTRNAPALARLAEAAGVRLITVHGRTRAQQYEGRADWAAIEAVKAAVRVPVIANGDIKTTADAQEALARSGADGVMIGRASLGAPWVAGNIARALAQPDASPAEPTLDERCMIMEEHLEGLLDAHGPHRGLRVSRKHMVWYGAGLPEGAAWSRRYMAADTPDEARRLIRTLASFVSSGPGRCLP
ncbi:tRNA dihydrouridine synthase DusB [Pararhodospirillum photometricum]|nr:tRNA dihydrouridine synthase DusB [Pararhodospirillum photometricum]